MKILVCDICGIQIKSPPVMITEQKHREGKTATIVTHFCTKAHAKQYAGEW